MRKALLAAAICMSAAVAANAQFQPLNVRTGNWQITSVSSVIATIPPELQARLSQLPPETRAALQSRFGGQPQTNTYNSCVKPSDLTTQPFNDPNQKCSWKTLSSNGTDLVAQGTCQSGGKDSVMANVSIHAINSQDATGSISISGTANGSSINSNSTLTGKWVGAACENN